MKFQPTLFFVVATAAAFFTAASQQAQAAVSLSLFDTVGDPASVSIAPGASFTFSLELLSTTESILGLSYYLETAGPGSGNFRLTARDLGASPFTDLITADSIALQPSLALLDPRNDRDLGALVSNNPADPGNIRVATFTVTASAEIPVGADYVIRTANATATDDTFTDLSLSAATYSVHVVPEPTVFVLAGSGLALLLGRRRRRSAAV